MSAALVVVALMILMMVPTTRRGPRRSGGTGADRIDGPPSGHTACCFGCGVPLAMVVALVATYRAMQETAGLLYPGDSGEWIVQMWLGVGMGAAVGTFVMCAAVSGQMAPVTPGNVDRATRLVRFGRVMAIVCLAGLTLLGFSVIADIDRDTGSGSGDPYLLARPLLSTIVTFVWLVLVIALRPKVRITAPEPQGAAPPISSEPIPSPFGDATESRADIGPAPPLAPVPWPETQTEGEQRQGVGDRQRSRGGKMGGAGIADGPARPVAVSGSVAGDSSGTEPVEPAPGEPASGQPVPADGVCTSCGTYLGTIGSREVIRGGHRYLRCELCGAHYLVQ